MVIYIDNDLLIINKPSGILVIPDGFSKELPYLKSILEADHGRLWTVHRLDKDTSGVLVFARNPDAHRSLSEAFRNRQVDKIYHALCSGCPDWQQTTARFPLKVNGDRSHRTVFDQEKGKPAITDFALLSDSNSLALSLIEAHPHTGYTHQIRAHLSLLGLPILGDPLYRYPKSWQGPRITGDQIPPFNRTALHAIQISFIHPKTAQPLIVSAPYPDDFANLVNQIKKEPAK